MGSREVNVIIKGMKLTKRQMAIVVGSVLGDGFLQKTGSRNARLRLEHGVKQKEYLLWKGRQLPRYFQGTPAYLERVHPKNGAKYSYVRWQSNASPELGKWREYFYAKGKKIIPEDIAIFLSPLALAIWYMDDGYFSQDKASFLYLGKVSCIEAETVRCAIENNFGITPKVYDKQTKGFVLYFPVIETRKLHELVKDFIHPSMRYKLGESQPL